MTSDQPKLMQLLVGEPHGGAERFFVKLAIALQERGIEQKIALLRDKNRAADLRAGGCDVVELEFGKGWRDLKARMQLQKEVNRFKPDIFMVWMSRAARRMPRGDFVKLARLGGYYPLKHYKKCDWLIGNTPDLVRFMVEDEGWRKDRARMISNFGELEVKPAVERSLFDTPEDAPVLLALGRLHSSKGFDTLIEALKNVPSAFLWLAGEGEERAELEDLAAKTGVDEQVRFLGWRDDQAALFGACDICVVPSRHEPLSNVVVEAWSLGVPVVATDSEGPGWLIEHEQSGLLSPIDDADKLAEQINRLLQDEKFLRQIADGGKQKWQSEFSKKAIVDSYLDFFNEMRRK